MKSGSLLDPVRGLKLKIQLEYIFSTMARKLHVILWFLNKIMDTIIEIYLWATYVKHVALT